MRVLRGAAMAGLVAALVLANPTFTIHIVCFTTSLSIFPLFKCCKLLMECSAGVFVGITVLLRLRPLERLEYELVMPTRDTADTHRPVLHLPDAVQALEKNHMPAQGARQDHSADMRSQLSGTRPEHRVTIAASLSCCRAAVCRRVRHCDSPSSIAVAGTMPYLLRVATAAQYAAPDPSRTILNSLAAVRSTMQEPPRPFSGIGPPADRCSTLLNACTP